MELNPNHLVTQAAHDNWHKYVAILLNRYGDTVITLDDVRALKNTAVTVQEREDGVHLCLVSEAEALELARIHGGRPS